MQSSVTYNVLWKFVERVSAQLTSLVVEIVLARLLLPEDYGVVSMAAVFVAVANVFVIEGLPSALIQKKDADNVDFSSVFYFNIAFSVLLYAVIFLCAPLVADFYSSEILCPILRVLGIRILLASVNSVQQAYVSRNMIFKRFFLATLGGKLFSGVFGVALAYAGFGVWALVFQYMSSELINGIILWFTVKWRPTMALSWRRLKELVSYGWKILFEGVSETLYSQLRSLLIGKVYSSADLGFYTKAKQFPGLLVDNICSSISAVLFPAMSHLQDEPERVKQMLRKSTRVISYILFPLLTVLAIAAEPIVSLLLTDKWLECVPYLQIFCITYAAMVGMITRHQALKAIGRSDVYMYEHIIYRIVALIVLFAVFKVSVMAIALSEIAGSVIMVVTVAYTSKRFNGYSYREQFGDVAPIVLGCIFMGVSIYFVPILALGNLLTLALQIGIAAATYFLFSVVFKPDGYLFLRSQLARLSKK